MPPRAAATTQANTLVQSFGAPIKQYPGQIQVTRAVQVQVPGKHFNNLAMRDPLSTRSPNRPPLRTLRRRFVNSRVFSCTAV